MDDQLTIKHENLRDLYKLLRGEIEWRSKACLHGWWILVSGTVAGIAGAVWVSGQLTPVTGPMTDNTNSLLLSVPSSLIAQAGLVVVSLAWAAGVCYILEKRAWISFIALFLRNQVEPKMFGDLNLCGWEKYAKSNIRPNRACWRLFHISTIETLTGFIIILIAFLASLWVSSVTSNEPTWQFLMPKILQSFFLIVVIVRYCFTLREGRFSQMK